MLGLSVFEDSWWGMAAGAQMLVTPICYVLVWTLLASMVRRNWVVLVGFVLVLLAADGFFGGVLTTATTIWAPRWALLPIVVLVLARTLSSQNRWWACGLGALLLVAFVLTPEFAFGVVAIGVALAGYEIVTGRGRPWVRRFSRTLWCFAGGVAAAAAFVTWLGLNGAVDDFFYYFRTFAPDHQLTGGKPIDLPAQNAEFLFAAALPIALALMTGSYFAWRLSRRHPIRPADWAMGSLALFGVLYYPKFLSRADQHVFAGVVIGFPLIAYVGARLLEPGDRDIQRRAPGKAPRHVLSAAAGALLLTAVPPAVEHLATVPSRFTPDVPAEKASARLGYAAAVNLPAGILDDLEVAVQALGPDARLFDFTNQPGLVHYLLGLPSPTRYPHVSMAIREPNQADLIDELAADPPELVLYWSSNILGLGAWDGIVNPVRHYDVSQWLLENYEPWFAIHGELLYIRHDLDKPDPRGFADLLTVDPIIEDTAALLPACDWGTSPVFLDDDRQVATDGTTLNGTPIDRTATFVGRAGPVAGTPVARVLAVAQDGTVLSEGAATVAWPDLATVAPGGVARGFAITVPLAARERPEDVRIVAVSSDNVAASIGTGPVLVPGSHLAYSSGRTAIATSSRATGAIDGTAVTALTAGEGVVRFDLPEGAIDAFDWLELSVDRKPTPESFSLTDVYGSGAARTIQFQSLDRGVPRYLVQAASCPQWRDFTGNVLYLRHGSSAAVTLTLQRSTSRLG
jgi:hypothetical protein